MSAPTAKPTLYAAWYCPFAQRAWMSLLHKGAPFEYVEIDPYQKTEDWMNIPRGHGQVPVLVDILEAETEWQGKITVPDSLRVMEYIDERFADYGPPLFPRAVEGRAEARFLLDYIGRRVIPYLYRFLKAEAGGQDGAEARARFEAHLETLVASMDADGPFFFGAEPGVVDFALAPFMLRVELVLSHYRDYRPPTEGALWRRLGVWWDAVRALPALRDSSIGLDGYAERLLAFYVPYSQGKGQTDITVVPA